MTADSFGIDIVVMFRHHGNLEGTLCYEKILCVVRRYFVL